MFYNALRKLILKGVDGVVFVVDSQQERVEANLEAFENLRSNLVGLGFCGALEEQSTFALEKWAERRAA